MKLLLAILQVFLILEIVLNSRLRTSAKTSSELRTNQNELTYRIQSKNKNYYAQLNGSGQFQVFSTAPSNGKPSDNLIWNSFTDKGKKGNGQGSAPFKVVMQQDGNLVIYDKNRAIWASDTNGKGSAPFSVIMQDDGNLVIYDSGNKPTWASNTMGRRLF